MKYLKLYSCCLIVRGNKRSLLLDSQRNAYYIVPTSIVDILFSNLDYVDVKCLQQNFQLQEFANFLLDNDLAFYCSNTEIRNFPPVKLEEWDNPAIITNAIIEVKIENLAIVIKTMESLSSEVGTFYFELVFVNDIPLDTLVNAINSFNKIDLQHYSLYFSLSEPYEIENAKNFLQKQYKIFKTVIYNAERYEVFVSEKEGWGNIFMLPICNIFPINCGIIETSYFTNDLQHITESQRHNTCLNRKIAIDAEGNIKNCPSMSKSYGNIKDTKLIDVVNNPEFQKLWYIHKDQIAVCKDCEFRHICTDCRAYLENPDDIYSKPLKCGYNPYTCEWEEWSTNPLKQQAIDYYGMREVIMKNE